MRDLNFIRYDRNLRLLQAGTLAAVLGCVALGSSLLFGSSQPGTATIADTLASASFSSMPVPSTTPKPVAISENEVISVAVGMTEDTARYYERDTGKAFSVALSSQRTDVLSDKRLSGFLSSLWIPGSASVVSSFQTAAGAEYRFYDYDTKASAVVGARISTVAASPNGRRIAYLKSNDDGSYAVIVSAPDGSEPATLLTTRVDEARIGWRSNDELSLVSRRADRPGYDLALIDGSGVLRVVLMNKENLDVAWSPDGAYFIYSYFAPETGTSLWLRSAATGQEVDLGVPTSARKCAWHPVRLAVTCGIPSKTSLSRDVPADLTASVDDVATYDFDDNTYTIRYTGTPSKLIGVIDPLLSSSGKYFVFTNMFDSRLYLLPLQ